MTATDTTMELNGWSRFCAAGDFDTCEQVKFACRNPRHKTDGETAAERSKRLLAEARAARLAGEPMVQLPPLAPALVARRSMAHITAAEVVVPRPSSTSTLRAPGRKGRPLLSASLEREGVLEALRADAGEWRRIRSYSGLTAAGHARRKLLEQLTGYEWEATQVAVDNSSILFGRYVGGAK